MNQGGQYLLQSSPVQHQQIMVAAAGNNPNWWSTLTPQQQQTQTQTQTLPITYFPTSSPSSSSTPSSSSSPPASSSLPFPSWINDHNTTNPHPHALNLLHHHHHQLPDSWSQLLLGGLVVGEEENGCSSVGDVKQEISSGSYVVSSYGGGGHATGDEFHQQAPPNWSHKIMANNNNHNNDSPPTSFCSSSLLDFSAKQLGVGGGDHGSMHHHHPPPPPVDRSSESNSSTGTVGDGGGAVKKARVQAASSSSTQATIKVRKEKLGDRITSLHQLVSPFGKTDTASVLLEAIGYIRFLQSQIEALSLPYLGDNNMRHPQQQQHHHLHQHSVQGERNCVFPEDPGQLLDDSCLKRKVPCDHPQQDFNEEPKKDLRSRGLCLVPVSCTMQVGNENGADYWAPTLGGGFR